MTNEEVDELIRHTFTANMVEDKLDLVTWVWSDEIGSCMGECAFPRGPRKQHYFLLRFSSVLFPRASDYERRGTIVHEACHATEIIRVGLYKHYAQVHGFDWETAVLRTGYEPSQNHDVNTVGVERARDDLTIPIRVV